MKKGSGRRATIRLATSDGRRVPKRRAPARTTAPAPDPQLALPLPSQLDEVTRDLYCAARTALKMIVKTREEAGLPPLPVAL